MTGILRLGAHLPSQVRTNDFWGAEWAKAHAGRVHDDVITQLDVTSTVDIEVARHSARFTSDLFRGARERRVMAEHHASSDMEALAARQVLGDEPVDLLIVSSQVPDFPSPLNHGLVAHKLGLPPTVTAMTLDTGCASFVTGAATASRLIQSGAYRNAIVVASSAMSRILDEGAPSAPFLGDGAVAALVGPTPPHRGLVDTEVLTRGELHGGIVLAPDPVSTPWYRGDRHQQPLLARHHDHEATHTMAAQAVTRCREVCEPLLARHGLDGVDIGFLAVPHTTAWFGSAFADALAIPGERVLPHEEQFAKYGHLMAASVGLNLHLGVISGRVKSGDWVLVYSPGAGFTQAAMLIRWP
ncbi:MAG: 3-oxoacyl-ACP synthase III family protein [Proteobacteria bacterium]|nr:3-oxoacyl-ACP synthase III family protein [Pseudomonadota bacterium]